MPTSAAPRAPTALAERLFAEPDSARRSALRAELRQLGDAAVPALLEGLRHADPYARWDAVNLLGEIAHGSATEAVVGFALEEEEVHARWRAAWAVCRFERARTLPPLLAALGGDEAGRRWRAAMILSMMRRPEAVEVALAGLRDPEPWRQWEAASAVKALAPAGSEAALGALLLGTVTRHVRQEAVLALGAVNTDAALDQLRTALDDPHPDVRWRVSMALGRFGRRGAPLLRRLHQIEQDPRVRERAREDLIRVEATHGR